MEHIIKAWNANAEKRQEKNFFYIRKLKLKNARKVDRLAKELHEEAFKQIDCLKCGNCCRTSKPLLKHKDISNIAKHLEMRPAQVKEKYLELDEDGDWVFNALPCPFLNQEDNTCQIYPARPKDCQSFPHTHKNGFASRSYLHARNTVVCPAVYYIVEEMKSIIR